MVLFNDQVMPWANHRLATLQLNIAVTKPTFALREQVINEVQPERLLLRAGLDRRSDVEAVRRHHRRHRRSLSAPHDHRRLGPHRAGAEPARRRADAAPRLRVVDADAEARRARSPVFRHPAHSPAGRCRSVRADGRELEHEGRPRDDGLRDAARLRAGERRPSPRAARSSTRRSGARAGRLDASPQLTSRPAAGGIGAGVLHTLPVGHRSRRAAAPKVAHAATPRRQAPPSAARGVSPSGIAALEVQEPIDVTIQRAELEAGPPPARPVRRRDPEEVLARGRVRRSSPSSARPSRCAFRAAASGSSSASASGSSRSITSASSAANRLSNKGYVSRLSRCGPPTSSSCSSASCSTRAWATSRQAPAAATFARCFHAHAPAAAADASRSRRRRLMLGASSDRSTATCSASSARIFFGTALGFPMLVVIIDLVDNLEKYLNRQIPPGDIALSYLYFLPESALHGGAGGGALRDGVRHRRVHPARRDHGGQGVGHELLPAHRADLRRRDASPSGSTSCSASSCR